MKNVKQTHNRGNATGGPSKSLTEIVKYLTVVMFMHPFLYLHHCSTLVPVSINLCDSLLVAGCK
jgi:hypothetical protein